MRRFAILTALVWLAVLASIAMFFIFWRVGNLRPHAIWASISFASVSVPMGTLTIATLHRVLQGPCRLRAIGWLLVGATPLVWVGVYFAQLTIAAHIRTPITMNAASSISATWGSSVFDLQARWRYPRWTHGQHAVLMDEGQIPNVISLVAEMDTHIRAMAELLHQPVPDCEFPWVRGPLLGQDHRAVLLWALCGEDKKPAELGHLDRHEIAHTLISALAGPDHEPPFVLVEGWAESQSSDRDQQISHLAEKQKNGQAYSLQELVGPQWYGKGDGPVYWQGGPLVHFLMEYYSVEAFYKLYVGVRPETFHSDCQAILGDSWETVESEFWEWIESEAQLIAEKNPEPSTDTALVEAEEKVEFATSVDPADWQAFVEGYKNSTKEVQPLPTDIAFLIELDQTFIDERKDTPDEKVHYDFFAIFAGQNLWIHENLSSHRSRFLMATKGRCADLTLNEQGVVAGWIRDHHAFQKIRAEAIQLMPLYHRFRDPADLLPLGKKTLRPRTCTITELIRPADGSNQPWNISYTWQREDGSKKTENRITVDPASGWSVVHYSTQKPGERETKSDTKYQFLGGVFLPWKSTSRIEHSFYQELTEMQFRPLSEAERNDLQQRVEQIVSSGPSEPYSLLRHLLVAAEIACPLIGLLLLSFASRNSTVRHSP